MKKGNKMKRGLTPTEAVEQSERNKRLLSGFTLIELITVVIIIAIMAALALPQYTRFMERGHGSTAKNALNMIRKAEATYFTLESQYTNNFTELAEEVPEVSRVNSPEWNYTIIVPTGNATFTATANRLKGVYSGSCMNITNDGNLTYSNITIPW